MNKIYARKQFAMTTLASYAAAYNAVRFAVFQAERNNDNSHMLGFVTAETLLSFRLIDAASDAVKKHARYIASMSHNRKAAKPAKVATRKRKTGRKIH